MSPVAIAEIEAAERELVELREATAQSFILVAVNRALQHIANARHEPDRE